MQQPLNAHDTQVLVVAAVGIGIGIGILVLAIVWLKMHAFLAMVTCGTSVSFSTTVLAEKIGASLMPVVGVMLVVGAGGGFKQALVADGTRLVHCKDRTGGRPFDATAISAMGLILTLGLSLVL